MKGSRDAERKRSGARWILVPPGRAPLRWRSASRLPSYFCPSFHTTELRACRNNRITLSNPSPNTCTDGYFSNASGSCTFTVTAKVRYGSAITKGVTVTPEVGSTKEKLSLVYADYITVGGQRQNRLRVGNGGRMDGRRIMRNDIGFVVASI